MKQTVLLSVAVIGSVSKSGEMHEEHWNATEPLHSALQMFILASWRNLAYCLRWPTKQHVFQRNIQEERIRHFVSTANRWQGNSWSLIAGALKHISWQTTGCCSHKSTVHRETCRRQSSWDQTLTKHTVRKSQGWFKRNENSINVTR